jgi:hypothetical protein
MSGYFPSIGWVGYDLRRSVNIQRQYAIDFLGLGEAVCVINDIRRDVKETLKVIYGPLMTSELSRLDVKVIEAYAESYYLSLHLSDYGVYVLPVPSVVVQLEAVHICHAMARKGIGSSIERSQPFYRAESLDGRVFGDCGSGSEPSESGSNL